MRFAKNTQRDTSKVLRLPRKMTMNTSKVLRLPRKLQHIFWKRHKSIAPATQNDFRHVAEHVWMSRSATPATRNEATRRLKPPKRTTSAKLPIGTAIRSSYERLRTVALANATSSEHTLNPQTPRVKRKPLLRIREWKAHPSHVSNQSHLYTQRSSTTSLSNFMPGSATLPRMRHLLEYLSRTFDNRHLAIYLKTISVMNCDCLAFSCNWAQPKSHLYKQRSATTSLSNFMPESATLMPESATLPCMRHSLGFTVLQYLYQPPVSWTVNAWRSLAIEHSRNVCRHRTKKDIYIYI